MDLLCFCSVLCLLCLCARLFIRALWSPAGKGLTSWLSFVVSTVSLSLSHWYPGSGVVSLIVSIPDLCTLTYFEPTIFFIEKYHFLENFSRVIFMGNPLLRLSDVLSPMLNIPIVSSLSSNFTCNE